MGKVRVLEKLRDGESIVGELIDTGSGTVKLKMRDGETVARVSLPENVIETIDDEIEEDDIIEIVRVGSSFEISKLDEWPKEEKAGK